MFGRIGGGSKNHDSNKRCPVGGEGKYSTHTVNAYGREYSDHGRADGCYDRVDTSSGSSFSNWGDGSYPTGGSHGGSGSYSASQGSQTAHYSGVRTAIDASSASSTFKSIVEMTSSPQHGRYLLGERIINLKNGNLKNEDIGVLVQYLQYQALNLDLFDISGNVLSFRGVENLFYTFRLGAPAATFNIKCLNLSNNLIGDDGAKYIASHLSNGLHPHLKSLDVSGNQITKTGEGYLVKALLDKATQHMIIYTQKLEQNSKLLPGVGTKEEKIAMYREYLKQGIEKGTNAQGIVVDKSFWGKMAHTKNQFKAASIGIGGFIKCNWQPDDVIESYAQEAFTATISKTLSKILGKLNVVDGVVSCYFKAVDEMYISETGQQVINYKLDVIGESEFCGE